MIMATIVNTPGGSNESSSGMLLGIVLFIVLLVFLFMYGLPMLKGAGAPTQTTQPVVPDKIDVNINDGGQK